MAHLYFLREPFGSPHDFYYFCYIQDEESVINNWC